MRRFIQTILVVLAVFTLLVWGGAWLKFPPAVRVAFALHPSGDFVATGSIYQETPDPVLAARLARLRSEAVDYVGTYLQMPIDTVPAIYAPESRAGIALYCGRPDLQGCVVGGNVFVSPVLMSGADAAILRLLVHETVHVAIFQRLSLLDTLKAPRWFTEGLAEYIANEATGDAVDVCRLASAVNNGPAFDPAPLGWREFLTDHEDFGLPLEMFYEQAEGFIRHLATGSGDRFTAQLQVFLSGEGLSTPYIQTEWDNWLTRC